MTRTHFIIMIVFTIVGTMLLIIGGYCLYKFLRCKREMKKAELAEQKEGLAEEDVPEPSRKSFDSDGCKAIGKDATPKDV